MRWLYISYIAFERKYSRLKGYANHQKHCQTLVEADILIGEKIDSLEQFCREKLIGRKFD